MCNKYNILMKSDSRIKTEFADTALNSVYLYQLFFRALNIFLCSLLIESVPLQGRSITTPFMLCFYDVPCTSPLIHVQHSLPVGLGG